MDLVSRLRKYISHISMPVTQFADTCGIPRPSMSQLLSGRNKKVSNDLISKIHDAFPDLNVLWLMFGQGDMLVDKKNSISELQNTTIPAEKTDQTTKDQHITKTILDFGIAAQKETEKSEYIDEDFEVVKTSEKNYTDNNISQAPIASTSSASREIVKDTDSLKRIVNIIVYYSDNSFEAFVPER